MTESVQEITKSERKRKAAESITHSPINQEISRGPAVRTGETWMAVEVVDVRVNA
jgi:hypothetical protein